LTSVRTPMGQKARNDIRSRASVGSQSVSPRQPTVFKRLRLFNRLERFQDQIKLTRTAGAGFEVFVHAHQHSLERSAVDNPLRVLVQFVKAFRAGHFRLSRLLNLLEQLVNVFRR
jgi:hypothetical protein